MTAFWCFILPNCNFFSDKILLAYLCAISSETCIDKGNMLKSPKQLIHFTSTASLNTMFKMETDKTVWTVQDPCLSYDSSGGIITEPV